jgi:mannose/cellobiose epimerase-like protein (N-acyl-D-glucosamine 2-epimerase family)
MNRRRFLQASTSAATLAPLRSQSVRHRAGQSVNRELAGVTLHELRAQYRKDLFTDFLPFMERYVIDHELGGFMCNADHLGNRVNQNKLSWFEGRGTWVYSFLYNNLARDKKYLEVARRSIEFTLKAKPAGEELWPKELTREGKPVTSAEGEIYGDLFIAEGLAEYSKATGERHYWTMAREILFKCLEIYEGPDYRPTIGQTYLGPGAKSFPGARIQGVWMVVIRLVTQMLEMHADAQLEKVAARCVNAIVKHHYNSEYGLINELLNHDLTRPTDEYARLVYTGHCIETLWMLLYEAARRRDTRLFDTLSLWFKRHVEVAWDDVYDGVFRNLQDVEKNTWIVDKVLWAQEEVLIGSMFIIERTGVQWAREMFDKTYRYVRSKYPLTQQGSPLWIYASDRKVSFETFLKMPKRVENFHHPRHLMLNLLSIERMLKR